MIANFFNKTKPIQAIFISVLFLTFYLSSIFLIEKPDFSIILLLKKVGFLFVFLIIFFLIRFINRKNQLSGQDSYVQLFLVLMFGLFPQTMFIEDIFIAHFFLLLSFRRLYSIRSFKNVKQKAFDSGFWIGVASLFYVWSSLFLLLAFIAILVYKKQEIRNTIIVFVGFITPLFLAFTYYLLTDSSLLFFDKLIFEYSFNFDNVSLFNYLILANFIILIVVIAIILVKLKINTLSNDLKPSWILLVSHFLIAIYIILFSVEKVGSEFLFLFFPTIIFLANLMQLITNKIIKEVIVYGGFLLVLGSFYSFLP